MAHQSEKHKMLAGQLYRSSDELLSRERRHARKLLKTFNETLPDELDKRSIILHELFSTLGERAVIEPPFFAITAITSTSAITFMPILTA
jgi:maltose O-acetyltransferase